ncbi:Ger(x)C family spore germination protein [Paenibacillus sp. DYY-L-2]|uniref:Ger(x)C family spore germination protein n=1 Tax=Paenibacillus sp. DYY-L-2 TaxID=3447013 RepID=UPI003F4F561F
MKRWFVLPTLFLTVSLMLTGCWNRRELNDLAIAVAAGVDNVDNRYRLTVQVVVPGQVASKQTGANRSPATLFTSEGDTIFEAARRMTQISPRKIYFSHLRIFLISESLAEQGMAKTLDLLSRDHEFRTDFYIIVTKGMRAEEAMKIITPVETVPANKLYLSLQTSEKYWSPSMTVTLDQLINDLVSEGKHPVLTGLELIGNRNIGETHKNVENIFVPAQLKYSGLAAFKSDKLVGWLNEYESRGYHYLKGGVKSSVDFVSCGKEGRVALETIRSKTKVTGKMVESEPQMNIKLSIEGNVGSVECKDVDMTDQRTVKKFETEMEKRTLELLKTTINKAQKELNVDIFGFGEAFRRSDPKAWKKIRQDWNTRYFPNLATHIEVNYKIRRIGTTTDSLLKHVKE